MCQLAQRNIVFVGTAQPDTTVSFFIAKYLDFIVRPLGSSTVDDMVTFHCIALAFQMTSQHLVEHSGWMETQTLPVKHRSCLGHPPAQKIWLPMSPCTPHWLSAPHFSSLCTQTGTPHSQHGDLHGKCTSTAWVLSSVYLAWSQWCACWACPCGVPRESPTSSCCTCFSWRLQGSKLFVCCTTPTVTKTDCPRCAPCCCLSFPSPVWPQLSPWPSCSSPYAHACIFRSLLQIAPRSQLCPSLACCSACRWCTLQSLWGV